MLRTFILSSFVITIQAEMEGFIVGGNLTTIKKYPFAGFLTVNCYSDKQFSYWGCGSSLVNQKIVLTAGHCVYSCESSKTSMTVSLGSENKDRGIVIPASSFALHEKYDPFLTSYDIALIKLYTPAQLSSNIKRVVIMEEPPYTEQARVAGWGLNDEFYETSNDDLIEADQTVWKHRSCQKLLGNMPPGTICASSDVRQRYPSMGDSGSALVVRGYIQIGLVSYKMPNIAVNVVVYTDVAYFYKWIELNSRRIYCLRA